MESQDITSFHIQGISAEIFFKKIDEIQSQIKQLQAPQVQPVEKLITRYEVAKMLGCSLVTIHNWNKSGILTPYHIGNKVRYKQSEVFRALQSNTQK